MATKTDKSEEIKKTWQQEQQENVDQVAKALEILALVEKSK